MATRQVGCALLLALTLGTTFNAFHLAHDYLQERRRIATVGQSVLGLVRAPAARAAFTLDHELSATVTRTLLEVPFVVRADLDDNVRRPLAHARRERAERHLRWLTDRLFGAHLTRRVSFDRDGRVLAGAEAAAWAVGTLEVEFDTRLLAQDFLSRSWVSIATGTARTILLGAVLAVVTHLMTTRPLERLVAAVESVDPEAPAGRPIRVSRGHERDELGRLARTIGALLARVATATAQRQAAFDRLAASEARYRAVLDTQSEFIARIKPDGHLSFVSDAYCRYHGRARADLLGCRFDEFTGTVPEDRARDGARLAALSPDRPSATTELRRELPDGRVRWVQWSDTALFDAEGRLVEFQSVGRDVTERAEAEAALRASEARFLAAAETLPDGLAIFDAQDRLVFHNSRYPEHQPAGLREALALGKRFEDWLLDGLALGPIHHPDMGEGFLEQQLALRRLDRADHEQRIADGRWVRIREARMPDGGRVLLSSDVTARRSLEVELRQAEKLKAVGTLASGIAHDFNNILATIFASTEVALAQLPADAAARPSLKRVMNAGKRGRDLVGQILTFSRSGRTPRLAIDLTAAVEAAVDLCRPALGDRVELRLERSAEPVFVAADETQIVQLVSNLCGNAAQAMPGGGRITVSIEGTGADGPRLAKLRVRDTGCGMDADTATRAFEPFFTTKPVGQGTGLGLAVVHGIVQALGGRVRLRTAPGQGTAVAVSLPCVRQARASQPSLPVSPPLGGRPILLVEPDDEAAEAIARMLHGAGYRVTRFADPADALEAPAQKAHPDGGLLVTALAMPGLSGLELAEALRGQLPVLPVILLAETAAPADQLADARAPGTVVLRKPVLRRELDAALVRLLTPAGPPLGTSGARLTAGGNNVAAAATNETRRTAGPACAGNGDG